MNRPIYKLLLTMLSVVIVTIIVIGITALRERRRAASFLQEFVALQPGTTSFAEAQSRNRVDQLGEPF